MTSENYVRPTLTPRKHHMQGNRQTRISMRGEPTLRDITHLFGFDREIRFTQSRNRYVQLKLAAWNGHEFEVLTCRIRYSHGGENNKGSVEYQVEPDWYLGEEGGPEREYSMDIYYPIDPRIQETDVRGALRAYPNETNDGWLFAHTAEGTHHDYELNLLAAVDGVFQPFFRALEVEMLSTAESTSRDARDDFKRLAAFYGEVVVKARALARAAYLGEREQKDHPREGWLDRDITTAVAAVKAAWRVNRTTDLTELSSAMTYIENSLNMPAVETRWDRAARLETEGADAVSGYEYVYTLQPAAGAITGAANLPDPAWAFDHVGQQAAPVARGTHEYWDGEPRPYVIPFKRPIPTGTKPGADVGSVEWEQGEAYKLKE